MLSIPTCSMFGRFGMLCGSSQALLGGWQQVAAVSSSTASHCHVHASAAPWSLVRWTLPEQPKGACISSQSRSQQASCDHCGLTASSSSSSDISSSSSSGISSSRSRFSSEANARHTTGGHPMYKIARHGSISSSSGWCSAGSRSIHTSSHQPHDHTPHHQEDTSSSTTTTSTTSSSSPKSASVRPSEAAKFAALADHWWDAAAGPFAPLHALNAARVAFIRDAVCSSRAALASCTTTSSSSSSSSSDWPSPTAAPPEHHNHHHHLQQQQQQEAAGGAAPTPAEPLAGLQVLDVGCGGGLLAEPLARLGAGVTGVDLSPEGLRVAAGHAAADPLVAGRVRYQLTTAEDLEAAGASFDVVIASEVIEHVKAPGAFLHTLAALCRPGGQVVVSTLNRTPASYAAAIVGAEYVTGLVPKGTHDWARFLTPQELALLGEEAGLVLRHVAGMVPSLTGRDFVLGSSLAVNYIAQFDKRAPAADVQQEAEEERR